VRQLDRLRERLDFYRHGAQMARDLPKMMPRAKASPGMMLQLRARKNPNDLALAYRDERFSWAELAGRANQYSAWFTQQGIRRGDVVALLMDNRPDYIFVIMGLNQIGAVSSLINTNLMGKALVHALAVCSAKKALVGAEHLGKFLEVGEQLEGLSLDKDLWVKLDPDEAAQADTGQLRGVDEEIASSPKTPPPPGPKPSNSDTYCYIYTSGTTGLPKAAIIRNQRMLGAGFAFGHMMHRCGPGDLIYVSLPLYHSSAMFLGWCSALCTGAAIGVRRRFSASSFWPDVRALGATSFVYIGELCRYLLNAPVDPQERNHRLRVGCGNGMRPDIWERFQQRFGVPVIREFYGSTEGNTPVLNFEGKPGMIGKLGRGLVIVRCDPATGDALRNAEGRCERIRPGEVGLLLGRISKLLTFDGYVDEKATRKKILEDVFEAGDQFFDTGDLIELHEKGWLSFADRAGDSFRWKGENVSTNEVAEALSAAAGVQEANVYGVLVPHADGRAGMAALATSPEFELNAFADFVRSALPRYQQPLFLRLLQAEMQITGTFKHQKVEYRDQGFDPAKIPDPVYLLGRDGYVPMDAELFARIERGELTPG
jgi:fatty-acyl-CoA synthase